ncbi:dimethylaniline monooxygenase-like protein [Pseudooceanicola batsensis HTCC2597]|uniref:Dimethylaniline monooxygenase-like protein n=1 Tax=Pseudooceanicola batsensis (strain ATCC BAA-863 / DSM 15984 / KCTC 12145 / HTCC2597) TaxID=252305 RepID=A3TUN1_PSEBH|nr:NAD(P)/FAD-dependent oxidoreductase [Pseudooceanicola batsensis]EAQ04227.1 dimethylaniline monooxygenase-like protein [Pseudooceanicola batsensis HTCC2597]
MRAIVVGAGPTGLAVGACLGQVGITPILLEKAATVGSSWRAHYDSLRLHTARHRSGLPGLPFPESAGRYPARAQVVDYLESYAEAQDLRPRFGCEVTAIRREGNLWRVEHGRGTEEAPVVVLATGLNGQPRLPDWTEGFGGAVLHSSAYRSSRPFSGQRVLVVGFGNSGGDIALDLARAGVDVTLSVRGPVTILPKELFGVPITSFGLMSRLLGPRAADRLTAPILRRVVGRPEDYGLTSGKGPATMVAEDGRIPMIDVGALAAIKAGAIKVRPGVAGVADRRVTFADEGTEGFDTVVAATGYRVDLRPLLGSACRALDPQGRPVVSGGPSPEPGLYFCSYRASSEGQLRTSSREAKAIATHVAGAFAATA